MLRGALAGIAVTLVCAGLYLYRPQTAVNLDNRVFDAMAASAGRGDPTGRVAIVEVDEASLAEHGRWPWPRDRVALLVRKIIEYGADTVALDLMFVEPDAGDGALAAAVSGRKVVVGYYFGFEGRAGSSGECPLRPALLLDTAPGIFRAESVLCSRAEIVKSAAANGFLNATPDGDGLLRRVPLLIQYRGQAYPSLALAALMTHAPSPAVTLRGGGPVGGILAVGSREIPMDRSGSVLVRFRGAGRTMPMIPAADVLGGRARAEDLRGKLVIVGGTAVALQEVVATPVDGLMPGPEVQATVLDNALRGDFLSRPAFAAMAELLALLAAGIGSALLIAAVRSPWMPAAATVSTAACLWGASLFLISRTGLYLSPVPATAALAANLAAMTTWRLVRERRRAEQAQRRLAENQDFMVQALTSLAAIRDLETGSHLLRVQHYTRLLCEAVASYPRFRRLLDRETIELLVQLVPLHDIGKVGVPDQILQKRGRLTPEEHEIVKKHVEHGREVLETARVRSGIQNQRLLRLADEIVYTHHERWDGTGYPRRLKGDEIPLPGRLMAMADVYDALVSRRVYKERMSHEEAKAIIEAGQGTQFDPDLVTAFLSAHAQWECVAREFDDERVAGAAAAK